MAHSYGYVDVNVETPEVADGLAECISSFLRAARPPIRPTMLRNFSSSSSSSSRAAGGAAIPKWDGSKFYTNFQVAR